MHIDHALLLIQSSKYYERGEKSPRRRAHRRRAWIASIGVRSAMESTSPFDGSVSVSCDVEATVEMLSLVVSSG